MESKSDFAMQGQCVLESLVSLSNWVMILMSEWSGRMNNVCESTWPPPVQRNQANGKWLLTESSQCTCRKPDRS